MSQLPPESFGAPFARVYREHAPMVRSALVQLGVAPPSLDDATQDVFVVLYRRAAHYDPSRSLKNWLWGIARGVASTYRRSARRQHRLLGALPRERVPAGVEGTVARSEAAKILDRFLGTLDADKCAVFVLAEVEGRSGPEISRMLDVNVNTVYARLRAARRCFASAVGDHHDAQARPLFASWLPSVWLPRFASVAAGAGALATALTMPVDLDVAQPDAPVLASVVIPDEPAAEVPASAPPVVPRVTQRAHRPGPIAIEVTVEEPEVVAMPPRRPRRVRRAPVVAAPPAPEPEPTPVVAVEPFAEPLQPWGDHIVARAPTRPAAPLVTARDDFVDVLGDLTRGL